MGIPPLTGDISPILSCQLTLMTYNWYWWFYGSNVSIIPKLISFLYVLMFIMSTYELTKVLIDKKSAILSGALLFGAPMFALYSMGVSANIISSTFVVLSLIFILKSLDKNNNSNSYSFISGIMIGLAFLSKYDAILGFIAVFSILSIYTKKRVQIIWFTLGSLIILPTLMYSYSQYGNPVYPMLSSFLGGKGYLAWSSIIGNNGQGFLFGWNTSIFSKLHSVVYYIITPVYHRDLMYFSKIPFFLGVGVPLAVTSIAYVLYSHYIHSISRLVKITLSFCVIFFISWLFLTPDMGAFAFRYLFPMVAVITCFSSGFIGKIFHKKFKVGILIILLIISITGPIYLVEKMYVPISPQPLLELAGINIPQKQLSRLYIPPSPFYIQNEKILLEKNVGNLFVMQDRINNNLKPNATIFTFETRNYYLHRNVVVYRSEETIFLYDKNLTLEQKMKKLRDMGVTHVLITPLFHEDPRYSICPLITNISNKSIFGEVHNLNNEVILYEISYTSAG